MFFQAKRLKKGLKALLYPENSRIATHSFIESQLYDRKRRKNPAFTPGDRQPKVAQAQELALLTRSRYPSRQYGWLHEM